MKIHSILESRCLIYIYAYIIIVLAVGSLHKKKLEYTWVFGIGKDLFLDHALKFREPGNSKIYIQCVSHVCIVFQCKWSEQFHKNSTTLTIGMFIRHDNFKVNLTTIPQIPSP